MQRIFLLNIFCLVFIVNINAQELRVFADTDSTEYIVGDYINYKLELRYIEGVHVTYPSLADSITNLDFIKSGKPRIEKSGNQIVEIRTYTFAKYDSADVVIPSYKIEYTVDGDSEVKFAKVNPVFIKVRTIEVDASGDIQDVKAPLKIQLNLLLLILIVLSVVAIITGAYFFYRHYSNKKKGIVTGRKVIKIPAYKIALQALDSLDQKKLWQRGLVKEFHSEITEIIRRYFEARFSFLAMEMTSVEVVQSLKNIDAGEEIVSSAEEFFANADLVKFAKFKPIPSVNEEMMKQAYEIVNKTKIEEESKIEVEEVVNA